MRQSYKPTLGILVGFMITFSSAAGISTILYAQDSNETPDEFLMKYLNIQFQLNFMEI